MKNLTEIKNRVQKIYNQVCKSGEVTPPMKRELEKIDERANYLQDSAADHTEWNECFQVRETIGELLASEAAVFA